MNSLDMASMLTQDPHRTRENEREKVLEVAIGREVRAFRRQQETTVADLSAQTGISIGMLSKIENGNTSPSLTTLQTLANALSVPLTSFFRRFEESRQAVHTKSDPSEDTSDPPDSNGLSGDCGNLDDSEGATMASGAACAVSSMSDTVACLASPGRRDVWGCACV